MLTIKQCPIIPPQALGFDSTPQKCISMIIQGKNVYRLLNHQADLVLRTLATIGGLAAARASLLRIIIKMQKAVTQRSEGTNTAAAEKATRL